MIFGENFKLIQLRCETFYLPVHIFQSISNAVVQAVRTTLPKLNNHWSHQKTTPMLWSGNRLILVFSFQFVYLLFKLFVIRNNLTLRRFEYSVIIVISS